MDEMAKKKLIAQRLAFFSLGAWCVSLALPGFWLEGDEPMYGLFILLLGIPLAWAAYSPAVYANVFFMYAQARILAGKEASGSVVIAVILALTTPFFRGAGVNGADGSTPALIGWGWGAVVWLLAIALLATSEALRSDLIDRKGLVVTGIVLSVIFSGVVALSVYQWKIANVQETPRYLRPGMALTTRHLCGVPLEWPDSPKIPAGELVQIDYEDRLLRSGEFSPVLPRPRAQRYQLDGYDWFEPFAASGDDLKFLVGEKSASKRYLLQGQRTQSGAVVRLINAGTSEVLYEQQLRIVKEGPFSSSYCPDLGGEVGVQAAILRAIGQSKTPNWSNDQRLETANSRVRCDAQVDARMPEIKGEKLFSWNGSLVKASKGQFDRSAAFCFDDQIGVVQIRRGHSPSDRKIVVDVFDRKTFLLIARFDSSGKCPIDQCDSSLVTEAVGLKIENGLATIDSGGKIVVLKRSAQRATHKLQPGG